MAVKVRLRALAIRALETGPGRLVFTLGESAGLDPFLLAKHVQASGGALRLTPDMKLVATLGGPKKPAPSARAVARAAKSAKGSRSAVKGAPGPASAPPQAASPALEAATGRELLAAARDVLAALSRCARAA